MSGMTWMRNRPVCVEFKLSSSKRFDKWFDTLEWLDVYLFQVDPSSNLVKSQQCTHGLWGMTAAVLFGNGTSKSRCYFHLKVVAEGRLDFHTTHYCDDFRSIWVDTRGPRPTGTRSDHGFQFESQATIPADMDLYS